MFAFLSVICFSFFAQCGSLELQSRLPSFGEKSRNIPNIWYIASDYGAVADGVTLNTAALQKTIDATRKTNGGIVFIPAGQAPHIYLTGPLNLSSHMYFYVDPRATLLGVKDLTKYPLLPAFPSYGVDREFASPYRYGPLLGGYNLTNIIIFNGVLDGNGQYWWDLAKAKKIKHSRPRLLELEWCTNVVIDSMQLQNSPFWTVHPIYCDQVQITNLKILNPYNEPNTDGIDPDSSTNVYIDSCYITCGDDAIAIKSGMNMPGILYNRPTANLSISNLVIEYTAGISIGSEMSGGVYNVTVFNIQMSRALRGLYIKSGEGRGGTVRDIYYRNVSMYEIVQRGIEIDMQAYGDHPENSTTTPHCNNVYYQDISGEVIHEAGRFNGIPNASMVTGVHLKNVDLDWTIWGFYCTTPTSGTCDNVYPECCFSTRSKNRQSRLKSK